MRLVNVLCDWEIVPWTDAAADELVRLRREKVRVGTQDLKIAALTLVNNGKLLSANLRDFREVPDLDVEDWLYQ
jgi:tRNA(fMet)-specific endonuclease VapC